MRKAFKYKLNPTKGQAKTLETWLHLCQQLYNGALEQRIFAYQRRGVSVSVYEQLKSLPELRDMLPNYADIHAHVLQDVLQRLDKTYKAFFARVKRGDIAGFPRFKGKDRYDSFCYKEYKPTVSSDTKHVYLPKIGNIRVRLSRAVEGTIKTATVKREADGWYIIFSCEVAPKLQPSTGQSVGVDVGLQHFFVTSRGYHAPNRRYLSKAEKALAKAQRRLARRKKGGAGWQWAKEQVAKRHQKIARQRRDYQHFQAQKLVRKYDAIAVEDLNVKGLSRTRLAKGIHDVAWGQFISILSSKAEEAGRRVVKVSPNYTSQICPNCGAVKKKSLSERVHRCPCGCVMPRDLASAIVIAGRADLLGDNVAVLNASVA
jgi:putative transposase